MNQTPEQPPGLDLRECEKWPYPTRNYFARALWTIARATVWQLCPWRIPRLRGGLLKLFGMRGSSYIAVAGSARIEMPWMLEVGEATTISQRVHLYNLGGLKIGSHTVISQDVYVCGGTHDYTNPSYPLVRKKIVIGDYVWIAAGAFIGPGVTIGDGAVVGARAVVVKDVDPWTVVAGNPARFIKKRELQRDGRSGHSAPPSPKKSDDAESQQSR